MMLSPRNGLLPRSSATQTLPRQLSAAGLQRLCGVLPAARCELPHGLVDHGFDGAWDVWRRRMRLNID